MDFHSLKSPRVKGFLAEPTADVAAWPNFYGQGTKQGADPRVLGEFFKLFSPTLNSSLCCRGNKCSVKLQVCKTHSVSSSSKVVPAKGREEQQGGRGAGRGPGSHQCLRRGEDRAGWLWRDKVCRGGRLAVKWRCHSSHSCSVVVKTLISTHTVCCLSRGVTSCELSPKKGNPPGIFTTSQQTWEALGCSL